MQSRFVAAPVVLILSLALPAADLPAGTTRVPFPAPVKIGKMSVEEALATRRSVRTYSATAAPLTLAEVGQLLWAAQGVTSADGKRTAPSAMHRYPLEIAVVAQKVEGLEAGAYRYDPAKHALELLTTGSGLLAKAAASQDAVQKASAVIVIAAVYERMGEPGAKTRTWVDYEAGLASENLLLQAVALRLGAVVVGGIQPAAVQQAVRLCAEHVRQLEGESPFDNLMEVKS